MPIFLIKKANNNQETQENLLFLIKVEIREIQIKAEIHKNRNTIK